MTFLYIKFAAIANKNKGLIVTARAVRDDDDDDDVCTPAGWSLLSIKL